MNPQVGHIEWLGFVIFAIVMGSLSCIILITIFGKPRRPKVIGIVIGTLIGLLVTVIAGMGVGGLVFSALMR